MEQCFSTLVRMSIIKLPQVRMYWTHSTQVLSLGNIMPINKFENIRQYFHCNDNSKNVQSSWRVKVWGRCGISGVVYDFEVYSGKNNTKKDNEIEGILKGEMLCTVSHEHCYSMKIRRYFLTISFHQLLCSSY